MAVRCKKEFDEEVQRRNREITKEFGERLNLLVRQRYGRAPCWKAKFTRELQPGYHRNTVQHWLDGETFPQPAALLKLSELTGASLDYLVRGE